MPHYEHVRNDLGKRAEYGVEVRRGRAGPELVAELAHVLAPRLCTLRSPALSDTSIIAGPFGPDQASIVVLMRTFDVWAHGQDIRATLGQGSGGHDFGSRSSWGVVRGRRAMMNTTSSKSTTTPPATTHNRVGGCPAMLVVSAGVEVVEVVAVA